MRALGGESAEVANRIEKELRTAAAESAGGMEQLLTKLRELDPASAEVAERIKMELAEAAKYTEGRFEQTLRKLRSMGPVGKSVADDLKKHLVNAGTLAEESIDDVIAKLREIDPAAAEAADGLYRRAQDAADKSETAFAKFGRSAAGQITAVAGSYLGVQQAIQVVIDLNRKVIETNRQAFESVKRQGEGDRKLLQVAGDDPADFQQLRTRADDLAKQHGISREEARNLVASARREGFEDSVDSIAANSQVIDVGVQTEVASKIPAIFKSEGITAEQAINATLTAANRSSVSTEELARAIPVASEGASMAGATASETLAVTAGISDQFNTPQTSADRVKALAMKIALDQGDAGTSIEDLQKKQKAESDRLQRASDSYRDLQERVGDIQRQIVEAARKDQEDQKQIQADIAAVQSNENLTPNEKETKVAKLRDRAAQMQEDQKFQSGTMQTRLERAQRDVSSFDQTQLVAKEIKPDAAREKLSGKGLIEPVRALMAMTAEQRESILGNDAESNTAYSLVAKNIEKIDSMQAEIEKQKQLAGSEGSAIAIKRAAAASDPRLSATREVAKSEIALEIEREQKRATAEGQLQTSTNQALTGAERRGDGAMAIAAGEMAGSAVSSVGGQTIAPLATSMVSQGALRSTMQLTTNPVSAAFGAYNLATSYRNASNDVQTMEAPIQPQGVPGGQVPVTPASTEGVVKRVPTLEEVSKAAGASRFARENNKPDAKELRAEYDRLSNANESNTPIQMPKSGESSSGMSAEQLRLMQEQNDLVREQNEILKAQKESAQKTADNTTPKKPPVTGGAAIARNARQPR
jgi:hypothetical protein